ncbi:hypothetical protein CBR_g29411 [Chara braunii]|uniref:Coenzyme Q-binding protein COQ10 START domain-containing protein n=1 Tax=Chara braunii TaxID=69332 RepID=A0A388JWQ8_CHABU|nr:hypothetical protein CBR_g29411 [Chara braunii]|eukprot:GBG62213.1 hypothetical protein CBR_g29411 [Chara braunii]
MDVVRAPTLRLHAFEGTVHPTRQDTCHMNIQSRPTSGSIHSRSAVASPHTLSAASSAGRRVAASRFFHPFNPVMGAADTTGVASAASMRNALMCCHPRQRARHQGFGRSAAYGVSSSALSIGRPAENPLTGRSGYRSRTDECSSCATGRWSSVCWATAARIWSRSRTRVRQPVGLRELSGTSMGRGEVANGARWSATWVENSASVKTSVPVTLAWDIWMDREKIPEFMPWISSVKVDKDRPGDTRWILNWSAFGQDLKFSWLARDLQPILHQKMHWRSVDGLPNRGILRFFPRGPSACDIELTIAYEVPQVLLPFAQVYSCLLYTSRCV